ncbi:DUF5675 family protein [Prevotella sp.]|uniref:DUF5675 family protein n=1 Tax=Prevotella sp. TaxID=59823 RepID=UPI0025DD1C41|nr:DUF5675 family protein [Prevotella sp.]
MKTINITIRRVQSANESADSKMYISGRFVCDCSENVATALPVGSYHVVVDRCKQYGRKMLLVLADEDCKPCCASCKRVGEPSVNSRMPCVCPMIKPGNGVHLRSDGSIIVGERLVPGVLKQPVTTFNRLFARLKTAVERGAKIMLSVESPTPLPLPSREGSGMNRLLTRPHKANPPMEICPFGACCLDF